MTGEGARPPEDGGGAGGYRNALEVLGRRGDPEAAELRATSTPATSCRPSRASGWTARTNTGPHAGGRVPAGVAKSFARAALQTW